MTAKSISSGECYTQSVKVDEQVTLLGGIQVHLQPAPLLTYTYCKSVKIMIPKELGIMLIIAAIVVAFLYSKMILIWRDVMLKQNERRRKDMQRLRELQAKLRK